MIIQITKTKEQDYLNVQMENNEEKYYLLMKILQDLGCEIQKYYWRSKLDETYIDYIEPKIIDVFDFILDVNGTENQFKQALEMYKEQVKLRNGLPLLHEPMTEEEINDIAVKFYQKYSIEDLTVF